MKDVSTEEEPILEQHIATIEEKENDEEASISDIQTDKLDVSAAASNVESNLENVMSAELPVQIQEQEVKIVTESEGNTDNAAVSEILEQNSADINEPAEDKVENSEENALNELHTSATEEEKHIENTQSENTQIETNMDKVT